MPLCSAKHRRWRKQKKKTSCKKFNILLLNQQRPSWSYRGCIVHDPLVGIRRERRGDKHTKWVRHNTVWQDNGRARAPPSACSRDATASYRWMLWSLSPRWNWVASWWEIEHVSVCWKERCKVWASVSRWERVHSCSSTSGPGKKQQLISSSLLSLMKRQAGDETRWRIYSILIQLSLVQVCDFFFSKKTKQNREPVFLTATHLR